jgi:hypothetical protein
MGGMVGDQKHEWISPTIRYLHHKHSRGSKLFPQLCQKLYRFRDVLQRMHQGKDLKFTRDFLYCSSVDRFDPRNRLHNRVATVIYVETGKRPSGTYLAEGAESSASAAAYVQQSAARRKRELLLQPAKEP